MRKKNRKRLKQKRRPTGRRIVHLPSLEIRLAVVVVIVIVARRTALQHRLVSAVRIVIGSVVAVIVVVVAAVRAIVEHRTVVVVIVIGLVGGRDRQGTGEIEAHHRLGRQLNLLALGGSL